MMRPTYKDNPDDNDGVMRSAYKDNPDDNDDDDDDVVFDQEEDDHVPPPRARRNKAYASIDDDNDDDDSFDDEYNDDEEAPRRRLRGGNRRRRRYRRPPEAPSCCSLLCSCCKWICCLGILVVLPVAALLFWQLEWKRHPEQVKTWWDNVTTAVKNQQNNNNESLFHHHTDTTPVNDQQTTTTTTTTTQQEEVTIVPSNMVAKVHYNANASMEPYDPFRFDQPDWYGAAALPQPVSGNDNESSLGFMTQPSAANGTLVFVAEGDLYWSRLVPSAATTAMKLTTTVGNIVGPALNPVHPHFVAFTATYTGKRDVYLMDLRSSATTRLTYSGQARAVVGWKDRGLTLMYSALNQEIGLPSLRLYELSLATKTTTTVEVLRQKPIPLSQAVNGVQSAEGCLYFTRYTQSSHTKRYTGGTAPNLWAYCTAAEDDVSEDTDAIPLTPDYIGTSKNPGILVVQDVPYLLFLSDRNNAQQPSTMNLFAAPLPTRASLNSFAVVENPVALTHSSCFYNGLAVMEYSIDETNGDVVLRVGGDLYMLSSASIRTILLEGDHSTNYMEPLSIAIYSDFHEMQERLITNVFPRALTTLDVYDTAFGTTAVLLGVRGQLFVTPASQSTTTYQGMNLPLRRYRVVPGTMMSGSVRVLAARYVNMPQETSVRRLAVVLATDPDSQTAEHAFYLLETQTNTLQDMPKPFLGGNLGSVERFTVSPCGRRMAWTDTNGRILVTNLPMYNTAVAVLPETNESGEPLVDADDLCWSPGGRYLAITHAAGNQFRIISIADMGEPGTEVAAVSIGRIVQATPARFNSQDPTWGDALLYFLSDRDVVTDVMSPWGSRAPTPHFSSSWSVYALPLHPDKTVYAGGGAAELLAPDMLVEQEPIQERRRLSQLESAPHSTRAPHSHPTHRPTAHPHSSHTHQPVSISSVGDSLLASSSSLSPTTASDPSSASPTFVLLNPSSPTTLATALDPSASPTSVLFGQSSSPASVLLDPSASPASALLDQSSSPTIVSALDPSSSPASVLLDQVPSSEAPSTEPSQSALGLDESLSPSTSPSTTPVPPVTQESASPSTSPSTLPSTSPSQLPSPFTTDPEIVFGDTAYRVTGIPAANYAKLVSQLEDDASLLLVEKNAEGVLALKRFPLDKVPSEEVVLSDAVLDVFVSSTGKYLSVLLAPDSLKVVANTNAGVLSLTTAAVADTADLAVRVWPSLEYEQLYNDAWRMLRDYFYDADMTGVDWLQMHHRYHGLVKKCAKREDLDDVIGQMASELSALHVFVWSGEYNKPLHDDATLASLQEPASLGAGLERSVAWNGYVVTWIAERDPDFDFRNGLFLYSPLSNQSLRQTGQKGLEAGDVIVGINGESVMRVPDIHMLLRGMAGRSVRLDVIRQSSSSSSNDEYQTEPMIVVPISQNQATELRYAAWEYKTRLMAEKMAEEEHGFSVGYFHLRGMTGPNDVDQFFRGFFPNYNKVGLVVDVRHNTGGNIDTWLLEVLQRKAWVYWKSRTTDASNGGLGWGEQYAFRGHLVVLMDEHTSSDGESFARGVSELGLGRLVGTRSWGGGIWLSFDNTLVDGGIASAPNMGAYNDKFGWGLGIEQMGVQPDVVVDNNPRIAYNKDPQLERAINVLAEWLEAEPIAFPKDPGPKKDMSLKAPNCPI